MHEILGIHMKYFTLLALVFVSSFATPQCTFNVPSNQGYTVNVTLNAVSIVAPSACPNGYNYNVNIQYSISINSTNVASMYTLQGYMGCNHSSSIFFDLPNSSGSGTTVTTGNPWNPSSTCNSSTVNSLGCNTYTLQIQGPGIPHQFITCNSVSPLPIELVDFEADRQEQNVFLNWQTASESNNDYFAIERSTDVTNWEEINRIKGAGNSQELRSYSAVDKDFSPSRTYYRLRQVDYDGQSTFSEIQSVEAYTSREIRLYPNPSDDFMRVIGIMESEKSGLRLFNAFGNELPLIFNESIQDEIQLDLNQLPSGVYFLKYGETTERVIKK